MPNLTWTREQPREPGWYWYRERQLTWYSSRVEIPIFWTGSFGYLNKNFGEALRSRGGEDEAVV